MKKATLILLGFCLLFVCQIITGATVIKQDHKNKAPVAVCLDQQTVDPLFANVIDLPEVDRSSCSADLAYSLEWQDFMREIKIQESFPVKLRQYVFLEQVAFDRNKNINQSFY